MAPRFEQPKSPFLRALPFLLCGAWAFGLWMSHPPQSRALLEGGVDAGTASCLANFGQLSRAFALYAQDFDGKIPRGVDPEDRTHPEIWSDQGPGNYEGAFFNDAQHVPYLHEILRPYVQNREVFHCPADVGWTRSKLSTLAQSSLQNVHPSSFAQFGTSYYVFTRYGFAQMRAEDLEEPSQQLIYFDGDLWHVNNNQELLNGMFADGHAQNLTARGFEFYSR